MAPGPGLGSSERVARAVLGTASALARLGVTPNGLTYFSLVPGVASGLAAAWGAFSLAAFCVLISGACDLLDGPLARVSGQTSRYGALLDSTLDRLSDAAPLLGLIVFYAQPGGFAIVPALALLGGYTISYIRARAEGLGANLPRLWMRRADRLILTAAALLLGGISIPDVTVAGPLTLAVIGVIALLNALAAATALWSARNAVRD